MDQKSSSSTPAASAAKKDEGFLAKTAHTILDKVHGLTDDMKEKTHNLTHSNDAKKNKKEKNSKKKTDVNSTTTSKPLIAEKTHSSSDSDDEDDSPKLAASAVGKQGNERENSKPDALAAGLSSSTAAAASTNSKNSSNKLVSNDSENRSSDDHKDTAVAAPSPSSSAKSTGKSSAQPSNSDFKSAIEKHDQTTGHRDVTKKPAPVANNKDHIRISFDGVSTVDDLVDRINEAVDKAKLTTENGKGIANIDLRKISSASDPSPADLEKKPVRKREAGKHNDEQEEPIRIDCNEIHRIEDLVLKVNEQPGYRKVIIENAPNNSTSVTVPLASSKSDLNDVPVLSTTTTENDDSLGPPKSILKSSQDPSSLATSTRISSFREDHIYTNIEDADDLVLRAIKAAVHSVPAAMEAVVQEEKRRAPQAPNQDDAANRLAATISLPNPKREAPKAPSSINKQANDDGFLSPMAVSRFSNFSLVSTAQPIDKEKEDNVKTSANLKKTLFSSTSKKKEEEEKEENETTDWI